MRPAAQCFLLLSPVPIRGEVVVFSAGVRQGAVVGCTCRVRVLVVAVRGRGGNRGFLLPSTVARDQRDPPPSSSVVQRGSASREARQALCRCAPRAGMESRQLQSRQSSGGLSPCSGREWSPRESRGPRRWFSPPVVAGSGAASVLGSGRRRDASRERACSSVLPSSISQTPDRSLMVASLCHMHAPDERLWVRIPLGAEYIFVVRFFPC